MNNSNIKNGICDNIINNNHCNQNPYNQNHNHNIIDKKIESVLIIEDNTINSNLISLMISKIIPDVAIVEQLNDSKQAISTIQQREYDLILLDLMMPVISGFDILDKLDELSYFESHKTRFIIITALLQHDINNLIQKYENIDILYKPIKLNNLKSKINNV